MTQQISIFSLYLEKQDETVHFSVEHLFSKVLQVVHTEPSETDDCISSAASELVDVN